MAELPTDSPQFDSVAPNAHPIDQVDTPPLPQKKLNFDRQSILTTTSPVDQDRVQVFLRIRPHHVERDEGAADEPSTIHVLDKETVKLVAPVGSKAYNNRVFEGRYRFKKVFEMESTQSDVFENTTDPLVETLFKGKDGLLFAYGVTNAGKTYTIEGNAANQGIIPRTLSAVFNRVHGNKNQDLAFSVAVSYFQVYKEKLYDLQPDGKGNKTLASDASKRQQLKVQGSGDGNVEIEGLQVTEVSSMDQGMKVLAVGKAARTTHRTMLNEVSSRSHAVYIIHLRQLNKTTHTASASKLYLVDLAGSERKKRTDTSSERHAEACNINYSLSNLMNCFRSLKHNQRLGPNQKTKHVPYRDSKLTSIFRGCLVGSNSGKVVMIVNASARPVDYDETSQALKHGELAKSVNVTRTLPSGPTSTYYKYGINGRRILTTLEPTKENSSTNTNKPPKQKRRSSRAFKKRRKSSLRKVDRLSLLASSPMVYNTYGRQRTPPQGDGSSQDYNTEDYIAQLHDEIDDLQRELANARAQCVVIEAETRQEAYQEGRAKYLEMERVYRMRIEDMKTTLLAEAKKKVQNAKKRVENTSNLYTDEDIAGLKQQIMECEAEMRRMAQNYELELSSLREEISELLGALSSSEDDESDEDDDEEEETSIPDDDEQCDGIGNAREPRVQGPPALPPRSIAVAAQSFHAAEQVDTLRQENDKLQQNLARERESTRRLMGWQEHVLSVLKETLPEDMLQKVEQNIPPPVPFLSKPKLPFASRSNTSATLSKDPSSESLPVSAATLNAQMRKAVTKPSHPNAAKSGNPNPGNSQTEQPPPLRKPETTQTGKPSCKRKSGEFTRPNVRISTISDIWKSSSNKENSEAASNAVPAGPSDDMKKTNLVEESTKKRVKNSTLLANRTPEKMSQSSEERMLRLIQEKNAVAPPIPAKSGAVLQSSTNENGLDNSRKAVVVVDPSATWEERMGIKQSSARTPPPMLLAAMEQAKSKEAGPSEVSAQLEPLPDPVEIDEEVSNESESGGVPGERKGAGGPDESSEDDVEIAEASGDGAEDTTTDTVANQTEEEEAEISTTSSSNAAEKESPQSDATSHIKQHAKSIPHFRSTPSPALKDAGGNHKTSAPKSLYQRVVGAIYPKRGKTPRAISTMSPARSAKGFWRSSPNLPTTVSSNETGASNQAKTDSARVGESSFRSTESSSTSSSSVNSPHKTNITKAALGRSLRPSRIPQTTSTPIARRTRASKSNK